MRLRLELTVYGDVQGVGYRFAVAAHARTLGLNGLVRNQTDGTVRIVAEGDRGSLQALFDWCYTGARFARVARIDSRWEKSRGVPGAFSIVA